MFLEASAVVTGGFVILPLLLAAGFVLAGEWAGWRLGEGVTVRRHRTVLLGAAVLAWLLATALIAASGVLRRFDATPATFAILVLAVGIVGIAVPCSPLGTRLVRGLPVWALVGFQVFRFPLEMVMHRAYIEGVWLGRGRVPRWVVASWNMLGFALLANVVTIAVLSTPMFRWFGNDRLNVFVTYPPFVWLPAILVTAALMGHILVWRWLSTTRN